MDIMHLIQAAFLYEQNVLFQQKNENKTRFSILKLIIKFFNYSSLEDVLIDATTALSATLINKT